MSQLNGSRVYNAIKGLFVSLDSNDELLLKRMLGIRFREVIYLSDGGATATSVTANSFFTNYTDSSVNLRVQGAYIVPPVTIAAGATANVTFTLDRIDAVGTTATPVATLTTTAAATAHVLTALTLSATSGNVLLPPGHTLRIAATKNSTGQPIASTVSPCWLQVDLEWDV
jgi:hypothetical protein